MMAAHTAGNAAAARDVVSKLTTPFSREEARAMLLSAALDSPPDAASDTVPRELLIRLALDSPRTFAAVARVWKWLARLCNRPYARTVVAFVFDCDSHLTLLRRDMYFEGTSGIDLARQLAKDYRGTLRRFYRGGRHRVWHDDGLQMFVDVTVDPTTDLTVCPLLRCYVYDQNGDSGASVLAYGGGVASCIETRARCRVRWLHVTAGGHTEVFENPSFSKIERLLVPDHIYVPDGSFADFAQEYVVTRFILFKNLLAPPPPDADMSDA